MGKFFELDPEVAGGFGHHTEFEDRTARPPKIRSLHYEFQGWLGDSLLETVGCFIATDDLCKALDAASLTGFVPADVRVSTTAQFRGLIDQPLPRFRWLKVSGTPVVDDFGIRAARLIVSEKALAVLRSFMLQHCDIAEVK